MKTYERLDEVGEHGARWLADETQAGRPSSTNLRKSFFACRCGNIFLSTPSKVKSNQIKSCGACTDPKRTKYIQDWSQEAEKDLVIKPKTPLACRLSRVSNKRPPFSPTEALSSGFRNHSENII